MAEEADRSFGQLAIEKGYCSQAQLEDAIHVLHEVRRLGLEEKLGSILVKKKVLTEEQVRSLLKLQGQSTTIKLAGYEILEKIGQGGMAVVFKARQISLDRLVALKVLTPKLAEDSSFCERFTREARVVAKLSHPNIIVGIDVGQQGKYYYFAMEYVDGRTALRMLREEGPLPEARALHLILQIARALEHAHKHGLVHRDIKPDNIMVTAREEAKLCDLGLAKMAETDAGTTQVDHAVGTPHYIAPEQARGEQNVGIGADIYSLGASLYHLVTGRTLFTGPNSRDIMIQHLQAEAPHARKLRPELSDGLCRVLEKMLAKEKADRHQTPADLIEDLERVQAHKVVKGLAPGVPCSMARAPKVSIRRGESHTTGPRAPVSKPDDTTGPRAPLDRPEPSTGPKAPVGARRTLVLAGSCLAFLVLAGLAWHFSGGPAAPALARQPESAKTWVGPASPFKPVSGPETSAKDVNPPGKSPEPKAVEAAPAALTLWEPLEKARQARKAKPDDYANLIALYEATERIAAPEYIADIRRERAAVEAEQAKAFHAFLGNRMKESRLRVEAQNYPVALGLLQEEDYPAPLMAFENRKELAKVRWALEAEIGELFNAKVREGLWGECKASARDPAKLKALRGKLVELRTAYPVKPVREQLAILDKKLEQDQREAEAAFRRAQDLALGKVMETACERSVRDDLPGALAEVEEALARPPLQELFAPRLELLKRDILSIQKYIRQAGEELETKVGAPEQVTVHLRGVALAGQVVSRGGSMGKPGVLLKDGAGKPVHVPFASLDAEDLISLAGLSDRTPEGRYAKGITFFWNGKPGPACALFKLLKEDPAQGEAARFYLGWIENSAARLLEQIHVLAREIHDLKLPEAKAAESEKRESLKRLVERFNRDFSATEVFRARKNK